MYIKQSTYRLYTEPLQGIEIQPHRHEDIDSDHVLLGYELVEPDFFITPRPNKMQCFGWCGVFTLGILFWPAMCVPCCMGCSYPIQQRALYGHPTQTRVVYIIPEE